MKRVVVLVAVLSAGCGSFDAMNEVREQTERAADVLEKQLNTRPQIGFNVLNGALASVNVVLESSAVQSLQVSELEGRVHGALAGSLKERPQQILISIRSEGLKAARSAAADVSPRVPESAR